MRDIKEVRRDNLSLLVEREGSFAKLNVRLDRKRNDATLNQILNRAKDFKTGKPKTMGDRIARSLEEKLGLGYGWMDQDHTGQSLEECNLITLNKLDVEAGCNPAGGSNEDNVAIVERIQVTAEWFKQNISRDRTGGYDLITARGDSMEPTRNSGEIVVVDRKDTDITQEGIFCVNYGAGVMLKRLQILPFGLEFISDNKLYNSFTLKGQEIDAVNIIGRVVTALCVKKFPRGI